MRKFAPFFDLQRLFPAPTALTKMNGVFNKAPILVAAAVLGALLAAAGHAQVYYSVRGLLADQFKDSEVVDFRRITLSSRTREEIERRLGAKLERGAYILYLAHSSEGVDDESCSRSPTFTCSRCRCTC